MFVIGTDKVNKNHKDWSDNLKFAIKVQQKQMNYTLDYLNL